MASRFSGDFTRFASSTGRWTSLHDQTPHCSGPGQPQRLAVSRKISRGGPIRRPFPFYRLLEHPLKFFTRDWVHGDMTEEEADAVAPAYRQHLEAIDLPQSVRDLASLNPHDAHIL